MSAFPHFPALAGAFAYEFRMQVRRPAVWLTFFVFTFLLFVLFNQGPAATFDGYYARLLAHEPMSKVLADWAFAVTSYLPICLGCLLANRLTRDRQTKVDELLTTLPTTLRVRLLGKYLGSMLATFLPHNPLAPLLAVAEFVVIALPGVLFVSAFSITVPIFLWVPLYQFLFICYWYWNTLWFHSTIPNLARTVLSPIGLYIVMGIFGVDKSSGGPQHPILVSGTPLQAVANILVLMGIAALVLFAVDRYLTWRQARQ